MINDWSLMKKLIWLKKGVLSGSEAWTTISGAIVEFITQRAHKLKSCVVNLSPKQDLHGYDNPWPAGGGVNKLAPASNLNPVTVGELTVTPFADGHYHLKKTVGSSGSTVNILLQSSANVSTSYYFTPVCLTGNGNIVLSLETSDNQQMSSAYIGKASSLLFVGGVAGKLIVYGSASAEGEFDVYPMITAEALSDARNPALYSPYSNICPISGWTGCEVTRTGKNLIDPAKRYNYQANTHRWYTTDGFVLKANQTYTLSSYPTAAQVYFLVASADATLATGFVKCTYTPAEDTTVCFQLYSSSGASGFELQLELGSTATDYEPYNGNSYSVTFGETVYGGTLDLVSGELIVEKELKYLRGLTENWISWLGCYAVLSPFGGEYVVTENMISSEYKCRGLMSSPPSNMAVGDFLMNSVDVSHKVWNGNLSFKYDDGNSLDQFKQKLWENPLEIIIPLETPITFQLTPQQVTALKGYNAMWSDAQSIEVTVHGTPVEVSTPQALNMLLGGAYHNNQTADDVSDDEALDIILGGVNE